ncbi:hypothetical protein [Sphingobium xenophagum]|uniref:hypothetical protein n=1 Tax=Sphingobium xenophagum TaxID=121428 RepID=UPI0003098EBD|nr:hypothetical protein [Sphingobium xenophagum]
MSWCGASKWRNEHHFLGPFKLIGEAQQEMNRMGREDPAWSVHGWEFNAKGEIIVLLVRSVEVRPDETV